MNRNHKKAMTLALFVLMLGAVVLAYGFGVLNGIATAINLDDLDIESDDEPK